VSSLFAETRELLAREGLAPRKRLGQHFLVDRAVVERMITLAEVGPQDVVLEIGPGLGPLTVALAARAARLYVIECDRGFCQVLRRKFAAASTVRVIEGDALRIDLHAAIPEETVKVVASLPYNVAVPILFRLLDERRVFSDVTVMMQREVAQRLAAAVGSRAYGAPSVLFQLYARVLGRFRVPPPAFYPRPQVTSEVLRLHLAAEPRVAVADPRLFAALVRAAFGQRRKTLRNALQALPPQSALAPAVWDAVFVTAGVDGRARGETLDPMAFAALADAAGRVLADTGGARAAPTSRPRGAAGLRARAAPKRRPHAPSS
jgi:16S rRNA (adenine1518-N6/adenine1519-N6)-dimethyltransferase